MIISRVSNDGIFGLVSLIPHQQIVSTRATTNGAWEARYFSARQVYNISDENFGDLCEMWANAFAASTIPVPTADANSSVFKSLRSRTIFN